MLPASRLFSSGVSVRAPLPTASSTAAGGSAIRGVPEDVPFSPSELQFLKSLKDFRNYFFVSRVEPLQHHFECHFEIHEVKPGHKPSARHGTARHVRCCVISGVTPDSLKVAPSFCRGPCCDTGRPSTTDLLLTDRRSSPDGFVAVPELVRSLVEAAEGACTIVSVEYLGYYRQATLTEFMIRSPPHTPEDSTDATSIEASNISELDRLDMELMASVAGKVAAGRPEPSLAQVVLATAKLYIDSSDTVLNASFWDHDVGVSITRLGQLRPQERSCWIDFTPVVSGCLLLSHPVVASGVMDSSLRTDLLNDLRRLGPITAAASRNFLHKTFDNPIRRILFLHSDALVEDTYAEFRGVRVELRHAPVSTLPEDIVAAEISVPISSCTLYVDVHTALCEPPSSCYRALCVGAESTGVSARLDVCLRRTAAASTATLIITDAASEMHVIPLRVMMGTAISDAGRVIGDEHALFSGTLDTPRQAVRIMVSARSSTSIYKACITVSNTYIFGNIK